MSDFIQIESVATTGVLGNIPRIPVLVTRETVTGFTVDPVTGLYKINATDLTAFQAANGTKYGLLSALAATFGQNYSYPYVYVLSNSTGVTSADLNKANIDPRAWSFITYVDRYNGDGTGGTSTNYFADLATIQAWGPITFQKEVIHTYSVEETAGVITLPAPLLLNGSIGADPAFKTIVSNYQSQVATVGGSPVYAYANISLAWMSYCINGPAVARSWGSISDAHDFQLVGPDTYSIASRAVIANASLAQYNGAKDRAGSLFVYDTQLNDKNNPPLSPQIETLTSEYYIDDYVYVYVHNTLQAAGQTGLPTDDEGIQRVLGLVRKALSDCWGLGLILSNADGSPELSAGALTAAQVTVRSANWQTTGIWPAGVVFATVKPFGATHYVRINFAFS